jgi:hypothetical protein
MRWLHTGTLRSFEEMNHALKIRAETVTYSFDYGNSHFAGIDLPGGDVSTMTSEEITWLDNDLTAAENKGLAHAFLFWHGPIYTVDGHPSTAPDALIEALNKHPIVSATFHGHEHLVTYTYMNSSRISNITHPFEEFVSGGAGASLYQATPGRYDYWLNSGGRSEFGFMAVDVSGNYFNISVYDINGSVDKTFLFYQVPVTLRIAGAVGNSVELQVIQDGNAIASTKITGEPGSPDVQEATLQATIDLSKPYSARLLRYRNCY